MPGASIESVVREVADGDARLRWSICVRDPRGSVLGSHGGADRLSTASIGKLLLLAEVARRCAQSPAFGERELDRRSVEPVGDSGLLQHLGVQRLRVNDLAVLVASVSDNLATNILLREVGLDSVAELAVGLDLRETALLDVVRDHRGPDHAPTLSHGSADELARLMAALMTGTLVSPAVSAHVSAWLSTGVDLSLVAAAFGLDPLAHTAADRGLTLVNKTGTDAGIRADVGAVTGPGGRLAYAAIVNWDGESDGESDGSVADLRDSALIGMRRFGASLRGHVAPDVLDATGPDRKPAGRTD